MGHQVSLCPMKSPSLCIIVLGFCLAGSHAATFTVNSLSDSGPGSLRQAILDANTDEGPVAVVFSVSRIITLASPLPAISTNISINGPGTNLLTISGSNAFQIFRANTGTTTSISGMTIANGKATNYVNGAGIVNAGNLTISNCSFLGNQNFGALGGAVFSSGHLSISDSTFFGNQVIGENGSGCSFTVA